MWPRSRRCGLSGARLNCESATSGTSISLANIFRPREMAETSWVRFSYLREPATGAPRHELEIVDDNQIQAALLAAAGGGTWPASR